jgi:hypothetical protein
MGSGTWAVDGSAQRQFRLEPLDGPDDLFEGLVAKEAIQNRNEDVVAKGAKEGLNAPNGMVALGAVGSMGLHGAIVQFRSCICDDQALFKKKRGQDPGCERATHRRHVTDIHRKPLVFVLSLVRSLLVRNLSAMCARFVERRTDNGSLAMFSKS